MTERKNDQVGSTSGEGDNTLSEVLRDGLRKIQEAEEDLRKKNERTEEFINERKASINRGARRSPRRFSI